MTKMSKITDNMLKMDLIVEFNFLYNNKTINDKKQKILIIATIKISPSSYPK